jgi:hypothetical protein
MNLRPLLAMATITLSGCAAATPLPPYNLATTIPLSISPASTLPSGVSTSAVPIVSPALPSPFPKATPLPSPSPTCLFAPSSGYAMAIFRGACFDQFGYLLKEAVTINLNSLDATAPFSASVRASGGVWVINNVPIDIPFEVTATALGWPTRVRRIQGGWFQRPTLAPYPDCRGIGRLSVVSFGGPPLPEDANAPAFYLAPAAPGLPVSAPWPNGLQSPGLIAAPSGQLNASLTPTAACKATLVTLSVHNLPVNANIQVWLVADDGKPQPPLQHPAALGVHLGDASTGASGNLIYTFTTPDQPWFLFPGDLLARYRAGDRPPPGYALWLVYPPTNGVFTVAPAVVRWNCSTMAPANGLLAGGRG